MVNIKILDYIFYTCVNIHVLILYNGVKEKLFFV